MIGKRTFTNFLLSHESVSKLQFSSAGFLLCLVVKKKVTSEEMITLLSNIALSLY